MKTIKFFLTLTLLLGTFLNYSQQRSEGKKIKITGKIVEKGTNQPLEYCSIVLMNPASNKTVAEGITDNKGEYAFDAFPGTYTVKFEFISFKPLVIQNKTITESTNLGITALENDATQLQEVVVRSEKTTVDIKLDKKVYNVGKDLMVKGGSVSDVLDNIPSVAVSVEGTISLRGNENVKILIDGKPSSAININDALRQIPADAIDKVEVITNPSARYDSEGGGGILNIVLKKGKTNGLNGSILATGAYPANQGLSANLNFKSDHFNIFTNQGYAYKSNPGTMINNTQYLTTPSFIEESRDMQRINKGYNGSFGIDWFLDKSTTWTNIVNYRRSVNNNEEKVTANNYDGNHLFTFLRNRDNLDNSSSENIEYTTNVTKNFKKQGHKLTFDGAFSLNNDKGLTTISDITSISNVVNIDDSRNNQKQTRNLLQSDYVLPIGKNGQFEAGYRGSFINQTTDYGVKNNGIVNTNFTNFLEYKEKINALYSQFGTKINKISMLYGMRYEDTNIDINQITSGIYKNKKYNNFFPSVFLTYELTEKSNISLNYSKRINRPRGREINPFSSYSSSINVFKGNPDLDPSRTDSFDFGYLRKWNKVTFNASAYYNYTKNASQMVRYVDGMSGSTPVTLTSFVNIGSEIREGFEFTVNYTPYKWWKLNTNFNFFKDDVNGAYTYTYTDNNNLLVTKTQDLTKSANSWSSRLTSKITLPSKIDWQTNVTYNGPQYNAQSTTKGIFAMNLAFSKDVLKDKGTLALNVNDVFNSRKRRMDTFTDDIINNSIMQFRKRQITLSFTYRFNKQKSEKEKSKRDNEGGDSGDFPG
ncbi:outer membrane beta-barrel family protein [Flavobacterium aciduliphilum]|uniref:Outer membrane receptor protein involved in Fe transport n=1 Tax=Flavobacterium aciduliphilum TaxID=1101402 RepID=A0A328YC84_9FLAO|nr:outer membrane beta-barrel family protein [Flavobacterium aciduliphilum]RAR70145.1 outer membrane receptor protein involved in Fe transport [Flavobacterium aciduliphilum]